MWKKFTALLEGLDTASKQSVATEDGMRTAVAALLVHASRIDGGEDVRETDALHKVLKDRFGLSDNETGRLIGTGRTEDAEAVDLYRFTRVLTDELDHEGRAQIVSMLWEIVLADGQIDDFEAHLVWRVAELLHIPTRERVTLRKQVADRLELKL